MRGEGRVHQDDLADLAGGEDVLDAIARDDDGDVAGDAVVEADVGDGGDRRLAVDVAIARDGGEPAVEPALVVDEAVDGAEPRVLVRLRRFVVKRELLEGVRPDEKRPRVAVVRRDALERRDEDGVGDGAVRRSSADDVLRVSCGGRGRR